MGKKKASRHVHGEPTGKGIMEHPLIDLNVLPANVPKVDSTKQLEDDLPPPPPPRLCVALRFTNVDLEVLRYTYKCLDSSPVVGNEHLRNLGFSEGGADTYMCTRDKKAQFPGKSLRALARSWLKKVSTKKNQVIDQVIDQGASTDKTVEENGDEEAKYSPEHIEQVKAPKASARMARKKRAKVQKQVCAISAPRSGKNKSAPKVVCCISPPRSGKENSAPKPQSLNDILDAIELLHGI